MSSLSSNAMKGASEKWRATGKALVNKIGQILQARDEDDAKLALLDPVPQPVKPHIQRLGHLGGDSVVGEANRHLVVAENGGCGLRMTHIGQYLPFVDGNSGARKRRRIRPQLRKNKLRGCG